jgi:hypothetical protein
MGIATSLGLIFTFFRSRKLNAVEGNQTFSQANVRQSFHTSESPSEVPLRKRWDDLAKYLKRQMNFGNILLQYHYDSTVTLYWHPCSFKRSSQEKDTVLSFEIDLIIWINNPFLL